MEENNLDISLNLIFDKSSYEFNEELKTILFNDKFEVKFFESVTLREIEVLI